MFSVINGEQKDGNKNHTNSDNSVNSALTTRYIYPQKFWESRQRLQIRVASTEFLKVAEMKSGFIETHAFKFTDISKQRVNCQH